MVAITSPLAVLSVITGEPEATASLMGLMQWTFVATVAAMVVGLLWLSWNVTAFRNRRTTPVPVWLAVVAYASTGAVFSIAVGLGVRLLDLTTPTPIGERIAVNAFIAVWWSLAFALFLSHRDTARKARDELIEQAVQVSLSTLQQEELVEVLRSQLRSQVDDSLAQARAALVQRADELLPAKGSTESTPHAGWEDVSELLRTTSRQAVRPLSKQLWQHAEQKYPRTAWWSIAGNIIRTEPLQPFLIALVTMLGTGSLLVRTYGVTRGFSMLAINVGVILVVCTIINALMRAQPRWHTALFVTGIVVLEAALGAALLLRESWISGTVTPALVIAQVITGTVLVFATSGVMAWRDNALRTNRIFREEIAAERVEAIATSRQVAVLTHEVARVLHGAVQSRLEACAMVIDNANADGDEHMLNLALHEALAILDTPLPRHNVAVDIAKEIEHKVSLWKGLCEFEVAIEVTHDATLGQATAVGLVVEEAISNSIRRGEATRVTISATSAPGESILIVVDDNGSGPGGGAAGVGSALIAQASAGEWSLTPLQRGSRLDAMIPAS